MNDGNLTLLFFSIFFLLWAFDILWKSISSLSNRKSTYFIHERIMISILGFFLGREYRKKIDNKNLSGNSWKTRGIVGLAGGVFCLYFSLTLLSGIFS